MGLQCDDIFTVGLTEVVISSTDRMENVSESITSPEEEIGSQGKSELCVNAKCCTALPDGIVTGVTIQLPRPSLSRQRDQKVANSFT